MIHTIPSVSGNRQLLQNCKLLSVIRMVGTDNVIVMVCCLLSYYTVKYKCTFIDLEKKISAIVAVEPLMPTFTPDQYENEVC